MRIRLALVLLAIWLALTLATWFVASLNFRKVDEVLERGYRRARGAPDAADT